MFLLDTVVLSEPTKTRAAPEVLGWLAAQREPDLFVSVLSLGETQRGILRRPLDVKRTELQAWAEALPRLYAGRILQVTLPIAHAWAQLTAAHHAGDRQALRVDALLAATAYVHGLTLVTRNVSDFDGLGVPLFNPWP
jgi:toxin FitB